MRSFKRIFAAGIIIFLFTLSLFLTRSVSSAAPDYDAVKIVANMEEVVIDIPEGASGSDIASLLFEAGEEYLGAAGVRTTSRTRSNS